ncbi:MAG TPA: MarC family protein [Sphingomicrobium sp.]|jgi:multiple antibiotic resistance protein|nr:MarC family protein [Sphingomicrobium sp.]
MMELFGSVLVTFLVIIDPPGCAPIFASLTRGTSPAHRRSMAIRSTVIAWAILMFFALLGRPLLQWLGISLASFRIAGGIMLFFIALDMVFERRTERREKRAEAIEGTPEAEDISVFPMAIPMITGPGSIASAMLWVSRGESLIHIAVVLAAITTVLLITLATLLAAGPLMRLIGEKVEAMITRILGVILAALAAQFVVDGLKESFPGVLA